MDYTVEKIYGRIKRNGITVRVPGSKSITARALLLSALAEGQSILYGAQISDDCVTFIEALKSLGIGVTVDGTTVKVNGCGGVLPVKKAEVYVGSAGTAARFITAMLAFCDGEFYISSSEQMQKRPLKPLIESLCAIGASFDFGGEEYCFPFTMRGTSTPADCVEVDVTKSSQFLSALLMAGVLANKPFTVKVRGAHGMDYVRMTLDMAWSFGVTVEEKEGEYTVFGKYSAKRYDVEPDLSAACYFYAANRLLGTDIKVAGASPRSMQGDAKFIEFIKNFDGGKADMSHFSDQALTLAAIAPYFSEPTEITGVAHIRGQECNRIGAIVHNLKALGVKCEEKEDGVIIYPSVPHGGKIDAFGDHRVAMSFAVLGLRCAGITVCDAQVCAKTFPDFFAELDALVKALTD